MPDRLNPRLLARRTLALAVTAVAVGAAAAQEREEGNELDRFMEQVLARPGRQFDKKVIVCFSTKQTVEVCRTNVLPSPTRSSRSCTSSGTGAR